MKHRTHGPAAPVRPQAQPVYLCHGGDRSRASPAEAAAALVAERLDVVRSRRGAEGDAMPVTAVEAADRRCPELADAVHRLRIHIEHDVPRLQAEGFDVRRPIALCFVDGSETLDSGCRTRLGQAEERLAITRFLYGPHLVVFGMPGAFLPILRAIRWGPVYQARGPELPVGGLTSWADSFGQALADAVGYQRHAADDVVLPPEPPGFDAVE